MGWEYTLEALVRFFERVQTLPVEQRQAPRLPPASIGSLATAELTHLSRELIGTYIESARLLDQVTRGPIPAAQIQALALWARFWARWVGALFYREYRQVAGTTGFLPPDETDMRMMMEAYLLRKTLFELGNELNHRPDWVAVPLEGILDLVNTVELP